jgi:hypothetical protein
LIPDELALKNSCSQKKNRRSILAEYQQLLTIKKIENALLDKTKKKLKNG